MPDPKAIHSRGIHEELARKLTRDISPNEIDEILGELRAVRDEVQALRQELQGIPSLIVTGREVLDEFKRLQSYRSRSTSSRSA